MTKYFNRLKEAAAKILEESRDPGHDMKHTLRVCKLAKVLAKDIKSLDWQVLEAAALLHDIGGPSEMSDPSGKTDHALVSAEMAAPLLKAIGFNQKKITHVQNCIISHRYKNDHRPATMEAKIIFDADKLDSIGAIGIARVFIWIAKNNANIYRKADIKKYAKENLGGKINGRIQDKTKHSPQIEYEIKYKYLLDKLYTKKAKVMGRKRIEYLKNFLDRLEQEINGKM